MGIFDNSKGNGIGYAKVPNKQNFTNEDLLAQLQKVEVTFGVEPEMGDINGTQSVMYYNVTEKFDLFVRINGKNVIMGKLGAAGESGVETALNLGMDLFIGRKSADTSKADHAVDELADIVGRLEKGEVVEQSTKKASVNTQSGEIRAFYMKQKAIAIKPKFDIFDENEDTVYHIDGDLPRLNFSIQRDGQEVLKLKKKLVAILPEYTIMRGDEKVGHIKRKIKLMRPELVGTIQGKELKILGDLLGFDFDIQVGANVIGHIDTAWQIWSDCYRVQVLDENYQDIMAALAIICDNVADSDGNNLGFD
ncbi:MAG: LURP-one-related family protein [Eubacterium sp.]|nr:LURP-one-related family protein [Eubacterium sp.]